MHQDVQAKTQNMLCHEDLTQKTAVLKIQQEQFKKIEPKKTKSSSTGIFSLFCCCGKRKKSAEEKPLLHGYHKI